MQKTKFPPLVQVIIQSSDGELTTEIKQGQSILRAAYELGLDAHGFGECGGNMSCGTCHVRIASGCHGAPSLQEQAMLDVLDDTCEKSRLGCQLVPQGRVHLTWVR